jgi:hypothetical protein
MMSELTLTILILLGAAFVALVGWYVDKHSD